MNTLENEIQALHKELNAFRDENITLYNELTKQNQILMEEITSLRQENIALCKELAQHHVILSNAINFSNSSNLRHNLTRLAGMQTAEFVVNNMNKISAFDTREEYLKYVLSYVSDNASLKGLFLEFGVFKGKSINFISALKPDKIIYGFDSFEGLPEIWHTGSGKGKFTCEGNLPQVNENVRLIKGWFNETLPDFVKNHQEPCAFVHVDCDLYSSTKTVLDTLRNQIVSGTIIAFDDYFNYPGWQECGHKAFMEFIAWSNLEFEYIARTFTRQVAVKIK